MNSKIKYFLFTALSGFALCVILSPLFYRTAIFNHSYLVFSIVLTGFCGAVFYSVLKYRTTKEQILTGIIIFILPVLIHGRSIRPTFWISDIVSVASLLGSIVCYKLFIDKYNSYPLFIRSMSLPFFLALFNFIATLILILVYHPDAMKFNYAIFYYAKFGAFIGFGLGIGFDLFEKFKDKIIIEKKDE
jgi:hypothetical protein